MNYSPDVTVVLATFDNAKELRRTLEGFSETERSDLEVEFVVVDNNSGDATRSVIEDFGRRLPVRYLHEARQGKCAALNQALKTVRFGRLVFFTDDDVDVPKDLFQEIMACAARNRECSVFGGRVYLIWPPGEVPAWSSALADSFRAYSHLDLGSEECAFPPRQPPMGTNWWIRREVLERGYRFDERIGPGSRRCSMGDETAFLLQLRRDGYGITYAPRVRVGHRVPARLLREKVILRLGLAAGAAGAILAYEYGFGPGRYIKNDLGWYLLRSACLARWILCRAAASLALNKTRRVLRQWDAMQGMGWNLEAMRIASGKYRHEDRPTQPDIRNGAPSRLLSQTDVKKPEHTK